MPQQRSERPRMVRSERDCSSTYTYRQKKVWAAFNQRSTFVEMPLDESENIAGESQIAATVHLGGADAQIHNGADETTLTAIFRALKSC